MWVCPQRNTNTRLGAVPPGILTRSEAISQPARPDAVAAHLPEFLG